MKTELDKKIHAFEKAHNQENEEGRAAAKDASVGGRAAYEMLIGTAFFSFIGYMLDLQLKTMPWITLGLFFVGFITGVYNAWRVMQAANNRVGFIKKEEESS